jgi:hypothetical protein
LGVEGPPCRRSSLRWYAEEDEVGILGDEYGGCNVPAVDEEVGEKWRAGGAEGHGDGQAAARLRPGGGAVAAGGEAMQASWPTRTRSRAMAEAESNWGRTGWDLGLVGDDRGGGIY